MILLLILALITILITIIAIVVLAAGGTIGIVLFGDLFVCVVVLIFIMKKIIQKKRH